MNKFFFLFLFCLSTSLLSGQDLETLNLDDAGVSQEILTNYENFIENEIKNNKIAGGVSLVARNGVLAHSKAMGFNSLIDKSPMTMDKIFYIQSMTKPLISVAFMTLYEQGHFLLSDPVSKYIPEFENLKVLKTTYDENNDMSGFELVDLKRPIEIWHLLSHTAGFSHGLGQNEYDQKLSALLYPEMTGNPTHNSIEDRVKALLSYPLMGQPGDQWNYSASPDVLALLIEKFSGMTAEEYLNKAVLDPLGMDDTGYNVSSSQLDRVVGLHQVNQAGQLEGIDQWSPLQGNRIFGGTHGLFSTAKDYLKFGTMLVNGGHFKGKRIIGRKTLELMTENFIDGLPYSPGNGFGLGFGVRTDLSDSKLVGSEGTYYWSGAFNTYFFVDPEEKLVAIFMSQSWPFTNYYGTKLRQFIYSAIND